MKQLIPIQNLYYLLCYVWDVPEQKNKVKLDGIKFHSVENLLGMVLCVNCEHLLKRGLLCTYRAMEQEVYGIKGKLNVAQTFKKGKVKLGYTQCEVDELSSNVLVNQILYSTVKRLVTSDTLDEICRERLCCVLHKFPLMKEICLTPKVFQKVMLRRNFRNYALALHVCKLICESLLPIRNTKGKYEFIDFMQDELKMSYVFERFLMNFCKCHCKKQFPQIHREYIHFQLSPFGMMFKKAEKVLPMMETDVSLFNPKTGQKKILDAKYYKDALTSKFGSQEKIRREHLSQIISYVLNQENSQKPGSLKASGTLVYPTVQEDFDFFYRYRDTEHIIHVATVNLNQNWEKIEARILEIVNGSDELGYSNKV